MSGDSGLWGRIYFQFNESYTLLLKFDVLFRLKNRSDGEKVLTQLEELFVLQ